MKKISFTLFVLVFIMSLTACKDDKSKSQENVVTKEIKSEENKIEAPKEPEVDYTPQSVDDDLAIKIKDYITTKHLTKGDLEGIPEKERKFQIYKIDLNEDGKNEIFVNFMTSYFCGTGGCSILLLNDNLEKITKFSVTRTPLFAEKEVKNGWRILLTRSQGELKELVYNNGTYPSNPSMVEKAPYDAPSGHAEIMFDENFSKPKTYNF